MSFNYKEESIQWKVFRIGFFLSMGIAFEDPIFLLIAAIIGFFDITERGEASQ